jgi:hypothetical protein
MIRNFLVGTVVANCIYLFWHPRQAGKSQFSIRLDSDDVSLCILKVPKKSKQMLIHGENNEKCMCVLVANGFYTTGITVN